MNTQHITPPDELNLIFCQKVVKKAFGQRQEVSVEKILHTLAKFTLEPDWIQPEHPKAKNFIQWLGTAGLTEPGQGTNLALTLTGQSFRQTHIIGRKKAPAAWRKVAQALARVEAYASQANYVKPMGIILFASLLDPNKEDYGDADIALLFGRNKKSSDAQGDLFERSDAKNLKKEQLKISRCIAAHDPFISLHSFEELGLLITNTDSGPKIPAIILKDLSPGHFSLLSDEEQTAYLQAEAFESENPKIVHYVKEQLHLATQSLSNQTLSNRTAPWLSLCEHALAKDLVDKLLHASPTANGHEHPQLISRLCELGPKPLKYALTLFEKQPEVQQKRILSFVRNIYQQAIQVFPQEKELLYRLHMYAKNNLTTPTSPGAIDGDTPQASKQFKQKI